MPESNSLATLPALGFLTDLDESARTRLAAAGRVRSLPLGEYLVTQGESQAHHLYLLLSGTLAVSCHAGSQTVELGTIAPGETVGEMNVIDPKHASADVVVTAPAVVWEITKTAFDAFLHEDTKQGLLVMQALAVMLCRRIRKSSDRMLHQAEAQRAYYEWVD